MKGLKTITMMKFNCFYWILFSILFAAPKTIAIDLARLYGHEGHEGHEVQKRSGNYYAFVLYLIWLVATLSVASKLEGLNEIKKNF